MKRKIDDFITDVIQSIYDINEFTAGIEYDNFIQNKLVQNAVIRKLEVIGEAIKKFPVEVTGKYNQVPWNRWTGMRDKLIHNYWEANHDIIWETIKERLPILEKVMIQIQSDTKE